MVRVGIKEMNAQINSKKREKTEMKMVETCPRQNRYSIQ